MRQLTKDLEAVTKSLKQLTRKTEQIAKKVGKLEKSRPPLKSKEKTGVTPRPVKKSAGKKSKKPTAMVTALTLIAKSKKGIDKATLKKKTGARDNNLRTIIYRLMKQGKIKSGGRGIYLKA